jgi:hypothetical protein
MHSVIEQITYSVGWVDKGIVDGNDIDIVVFDAVRRLADKLVQSLGSSGRYLRVAEDDSANAAEAVDTNL